MSNIAVIDYGSGNLRSVVNAVRAAASDLGTSHEVMLVTNGDELAQADFVILPGVGHFADCRANLAQATGLEEALQEVVQKKGRPFLGICVGMQMLADTGYEGEAITGLSWIHGDVRKLEPTDKALKIPHMGWNSLISCQAHPVTSQMSDEAQVYFVHSYHFLAASKDNIVATTHYGQDVTAVIAKDNIIGTQFHPEKSQKEGQAFLRGFLQWRPS